MAAVNKCVFIGRLTAAPDIRYSQNGEQVTNINLAINERRKNKNGETHEITEFVRVVAFRKLAEIIGQYCKKGDQIYIEGKLQTRKWSDKNGQDHYTTEIIADQMQMLGGKDNGNRGQSEKPEWSPDPQPTPAPQTFDGDIPF
jgi:single-strand binding protein|nr:MAG TPA: Single strand binding protein [Caudoviricetes sp.]